MKFDERAELTLLSLLSIILLMLIIYSIFASDTTVVESAANLLVFIFIQVIFVITIGLTIMAGEMLTALAAGRWDRAVDMSTKANAQITGGFAAAVRVAIFKRGLRL